MKINKTFMSILLMMGMFAFVACEKDGDQNLSKENAEVQISNTENELITKSNEIVATDGYKIQEYIFTELSNPFSVKSVPMKTGNPSMVQRVMDISRQNMMLDHPEINFYFDYFLLENFNDLTGTWEWNPNTQSYDHTSTPTNEVVVKFPYPAGNATNNVTLTYYDFTFSNDGITGIKIKIEKDGTQVFSFTYSATYAMNGANINITATFGQFSITNAESYNMTMDNSGIVVNYNKDFAFKKDGKLFYSEKADVALTGTDQNNMNFVMDAKQVIANLEFRLKIEGNPNEFETGDPNEFVTFSLYTTSGDKVGEFVFVQEQVNGGSEWVLYFKYNNGEQVNAETLMPYVTERVTSFINEVYSSILA